MLKRFVATFVVAFFLPLAVLASSISFDDRYQTFNPSTSTDALTLDFPISSTSDLEVYVNGTATTDFTVTATFSDGVATGAQVNINTPVVSNPTVEVVGAREPSRTQFTVASGYNLVGKINSEIAQRTIEIQEIYRDTGRSLKFPYGDGADATLPDSSDRANKYILFDNSGVPTVVGSTPAADADRFGTVTAVQAASIEDSVNAIRTAGYAAEGDGGGALYEKVVSEPSHDLKIQSADGAWWELSPQDGIINVRQAGAVGDGTTDDGPEFLDALAGVEDFNTSGVNDAVHTVVVPPGDYDLQDTTLELKKAVRLVGGGSGVPGVQPAILRWDANITGIIVHREGTTGATTEGTGTGAGEASIIEGLHLVSAGGDIASVTDDTLGHGIWLRARAVLRNLLIEDFPGNGVHILAVSGGGGATEGNANLWRAENVSAAGNHKHGFYVDGADANAGTAIGIDVRSNGRAGIWDSSFLGNTYVGCHSDGNGFAGRAANTSSESSIVHYNDGGTDKHFIAHIDATEAELVATTPGTDATVWVYVADGTSSGGIPTWTASQPEGTYFVGGPYLADNANASNLFFNCYLENGYSQIKPPGYVVGGINMGANAAAAGGILGGGKTGFAQTLIEKNVTIEGDLVLDKDQPLFRLTDGTNGDFDLSHRLGRVEFDVPDGTNVRFGSSGQNVNNFQVHKSGAFEAIVSGNKTTGADQAALTNSTGGTRDDTLSAVGDTSASDQSGVINDNFTELHTLLDEIRSALVQFRVIHGGP